MKDEQLENAIVTLHISRGWSVRELSREFGISRGRVRRIIARHRHKRQTGRDYRRPKTNRPSKLDQNKGYITELLEKHKDPPITKQRIIELIRGKG
jgi:transposase